MSEWPLTALVGGQSLRVVTYRSHGQRLAALRDLPVESVDGLPTLLTVDSAAGANDAEI